MGRGVPNDSGNGSKVTSRRLRVIAVALGLTTICTAWIVEPLVKLSHGVIYHWSGSATALFGPAAVDVAVVWVALTLLLLSAQRPGRWRVAVWAGILLSLPWIVLRNVGVLWPGLVHYVALPRVWVALIVWALLVALWRPAHSKRSEPVIELASTVLAFVALSGVLFLAEFTCFWWQARGFNDPFHPQRGAVATAQKPRIIWLVLDELSYRQVYERRYPGVELPAFDALAAESTVLTDVVPAGEYTDLVLPSLITGLPVESVRSSANGLLLIRSSGRWRRFDEHNTVFQDALNNGYKTAVAGWFNPYCRILPQVLDDCYWTFGQVLGNGMASDGTFSSNLSGSAKVALGDGTLYDLFWRRLHVPRMRNRNPELHIADYRSLFSQSDRLLNDPSADFVLLHLPLPHPEGIYDRRTGRLTTGPSTYIDNLVLADRYLAHLRSLLESRGEWDSATIVVMGDHSWRTTLMWAKAPGWTREEELASDGGSFDPRPAYIVKLAGETSGNRIGVPFDAKRTRALMDALMSGKIQSAQDLQGWIENRRPPGTQRAGTAAETDPAVQRPPGAEETARDQVSSSP